MADGEHSDEYISVMQQVTEIRQEIRELREEVVQLPGKGPGSRRDAQRPALARSGPPVANVRGVAGARGAVVLTAAGRPLFMIEFAGCYSRTFLSTYVRGYVLKYTRNGVGT